MTDSKNKILTLTAEQMAWITKTAAQQCGAGYMAAYVVRCAENITPDMSLSEVKKVWESLPDSISDLD